MRKYTIGFRGFAKHHPQLPAPYNTGTVQINARDGGPFNGRLASIKNSANRMILFDQDPNNMDDANFSPNPYKWPTVAGAPNNAMDLIASYHDFTTAKTRARNG